MWRTGSRSWHDDRSDVKLGTSLKIVNTCNLDSFVSVRRVQHACKASLDIAYFLTPYQTLVRSTAWMSGHSHELEPLGRLSKGNEHDLPFASFQFGALFCVIESGRPTKWDGVVDVFHCDC